jgi:glucose/arabinose dehydrogenase
MNKLEKFLLFITMTFAGLPAFGDISKLGLPEGFTISNYTSNIDNARQMVEGDNFIFVGTRSAGNVYAVHKSDTNKVITLLKEMDMPTGVALKDGDLYIAETDSIHVIKDIEKKLTSGDDLTSEIFFNDLPRQGMWNPLKKSWHGWKWIDFGPDGALYISEGVPCNVCDEDDARFGTILKLKNNTLSVYADGVRNSVGFDWHPETNEMYFTDNGRDWMGDDIPPCELNRVSTAGDHFGFPYVHGKDIADDSYQKPEGFKYEEPVWQFQAHTAPLGIKFYTGDSFPEYYKNGAFVAQHGSWNRSKKVGYKVLFMKFEDGKVISSETFIDGWLQGEESWGTPVTPLFLKDGSMLISDDTSDTIFRVTYQG